VDLFENMLEREVLLLYNMFVEYDILIKPRRIRNDGGEEVF
jgi:hypothetical protein